MLKVPRGKDAGQDETKKTGVPVSLAEDAGWCLCNDLPDIFIVVNI